jgi:LysM repeat protein
LNKEPYHVYKKFLQLFVLISLLVASFATTTSASAAYSCGTSVTVVKGDTLRKIAERCGTTVYALRRANPEIGSGDLIYPNQVLLLPGAILYGNNGYNTYIVMRGDTLRSLANRFGTSIDVLLSPEQEHHQRQRDLRRPAPGGALRQRRADHPTARFRADLHRPAR